MAGRRKPAPPEEAGAPAWMNTYGDMITLLFTFFVLLFSFSTLNAKKFQDMSTSLAGGSNGFGGSSSGFSVIQPINPVGGSTGNAVVKERTFDGLFTEIKTHIQKNNLEKFLNVVKTDNVILLRMTDSALFSSGSDAIKKEAMEMLKSVSQILQDYIESISTIRIEGHTDNVPISNSRFESNWELSTCRAANVLKFLIENTNIKPETFSIVGYGEFRPVASNDTKEGRSLNRRVDFVIESLET